MKVPSKFVIGNVPYEVETIKGSITEGNKEYAGRIEYGKQAIQISDELKEQHFSKILLHELTHGILEECGMSKYNKEDFVDRLSTALYDFLLHNDVSFIRKKNNAADQLDSLQYSIGMWDNIFKKEAKKTGESLYEKQRLSPAEEANPARRPRKLPINNERSLSVSLGELAAVDKEKPKHWTTGIKQKDGIDCYKTRYECVACGNRGTRYVPDDIDYVKCHECNEKMQKIPATTGGFPDRDSWGNFFIAGEVTMSEA